MTSNDWKPAKVDGGYYVFRVGSGYRNEYAIENGQVFKTPYLCLAQEVADELNKIGG